LLNKDNVPVPEFRDIFIPVATPAAMGLGFTRRYHNKIPKRKRRKK
jgi:hypothetical protein